MKTSKAFMMALCLAASLLIGHAALAQGGQTQRSTLRGAGLGALVGQAIGHDTGSTVAGAVVGAGVGHVAGKKKEQAQAVPTPQPAAPASTEPQGKDGGADAADAAQPLYDSFWQVESISPKDRVPAFFSKLVLFLRDGRVQTLTTSAEGKASLSEEPFSAVGDTLVIDKSDNAVQVKFKVEGDRLILSAEDFSAILNRVGQAGE